MTSPIQIADAYEAVARANHIMVGLVVYITDAERSEAADILVDRINILSRDKLGGVVYKRLQRAYDALLRDARKARSNAQKKS